MKGKGFTNDAIPALSACDSPIEGKFVQSFFVEMKKHGLYPSYFDDESSKIGVSFQTEEDEECTGFDKGRQYCFTILLQHKPGNLNGARVDVLLTVDDHMADLSFVIELDGAKWHSSEEQQKKDRIRDRELLLSGTPVIRFSGSEMFSDSDVLVSDLVRQLCSMVSARSHLEFSNYQSGFECGTRRAHGQELQCSSCRSTQ